MKHAAFLRAVAHDVDAVSKRFRKPERRRAALVRVLKLRARRGCPHALAWWRELGTVGE